MTATPHPEPELLTALADAELDEVDTAAVLAHVDGCPPCRDALALERATGGWLRALPPVAPPSSFYADVLARGPAPRAHVRRHQRVGVANIAAAAAVWFGVVGVARLTTGGETVTPALADLVSAHAASRSSASGAATASSDAVPTRLAATYRLVDVRVADGRRQALYTDGSGYLSMFVEPGRLDTGALPAGARATTLEGRPAWVVAVEGDDLVLVQGDDAVVVLVGPGAQDSTAVMAAADGRPPSPSIRTRVEAAARGLLDSFGFG